jgi:hypothetical protein
VNRSVQLNRGEADGTELLTRVNPADHITTDIWLETEPGQVAPTAATTTWDGRPLQRDYAISVIDQRRSA